MDNKIRLLGIVPFESLRAQLQFLADEYPQIEMELHVGNMDEGVHIAGSRSPLLYDVVISRGGTARLIQEMGIPVVEIQFSPYDILCALKLSTGICEKIAMVAYANITMNAKVLCDLLGYQIDIFTVDKPTDLEPTLREVMDNSYTTVLCDMTANITATKLGLNAILVNSGIESIRSALDRVVTLGKIQKQWKERADFFEELLCSRSGITVVFDQHGELTFSTLKNTSPEHISLLRQKATGDSDAVPQSVKLDGVPYSLRIQSAVCGKQNYTVLQLENRKFQLCSKQSGIIYSSCVESEQYLADHAVYLSGMNSAIRSEIDRLSKSCLPLIIVGEEGSGHGVAVNLMHTQTAHKIDSLILISCKLLNEKSWPYLLEHHNSPFTDSGNTICFSDVDTLQPAQRELLVAALTDIGVYRRNRIIFSYVVDHAGTLPESARVFLDKMGCEVLNLPPLREISEHIPMLLTQLLSRFNADLPVPVLDVEPEALHLLQEYQWPQNYAQFHRVIRELLLNTTSQTISKDNVHRVLQKEMENAATVGNSRGAETLDLHRSLYEINQEIAFRILKETNGNRTEAAKRLGIGRTSLWRLMQKE